jgi:hypothetical protein
MQRVARVPYQGWPNCYRLRNDSVELVVTSDVGPRIIRFGFLGDNELVEFPAQLGRTGGADFRLYGGHRLWHAPERVDRTYYPDNGPVAVAESERGLQLVQPPEPTTGIQKEMEIALAPSEAYARVLHRLRNRSLWTVELGVWALTAMAPGGTAVIPLPPRGRHPEDLPPRSTLTLWAYTDLSDPRWRWGRQYLLLRSDPGLTSPQKLGASVSDGWVAHARRGHLFVKTFAHIPAATYPDFGSSVEVFTDAAMLELETLGPLTRLEPGGTAEHLECWHLWRDVPTPQNDADVEAHLLPRVRDALREEASRRPPSAS